LSSGTFVSIMLFLCEMLFLKPKRPSVVWRDIYNLRIFQEYFQPKIGRKIRIFSLGRKNNILIKKKKECTYRLERMGYRDFFNANR